MTKRAKLSGLTVDIVEKLLEKAFARLEISALFHERSQSFLRLSLANFVVGQQVT